jgi:hypothetical protein
VWVFPSLKKRSRRACGVAPKRGVGLTIFNAGDYEPEALSAQYIDRYRRAGTLPVSWALDFAMSDDARNDARLIIYNAGTAFLAGAWLWLGIFLAVRQFF